MVITKVFTMWDKLLAKMEKQVEQLIRVRDGA